MTWKDASTAPGVKTVVLLGDPTRPSDTVECNSCVRRSIEKTAGFGGILVVAFTTVAAAQPNEAPPARQPVVTELSAHASATTFWVIEPDGWRVVTIVDTVSDEKKHAVVRFSSVLLPGQSQLISIPLALGEQQLVLRISRINDRIQVERIPGV